MKFGKQLQLNSYAPWTDKYLAYGKIKRMLKRYQFVKKQRQRGEDEEEVKFAKKEAAIVAEVLASPSIDPERTPLTAGRSTGNGAASRHADRKALYGSGQGGGRTYHSNSSDEAMPPAEAFAPAKEIVEEHEEFVRLRRQESAAQGNLNAAEFFEAVDAELHKVEQFFKGKHADLEQIVNLFEQRYRMSNSWAVPSGNKLTPVFEAYTEIAALAKYVEMNGEGFRKIVKKYDKIMGSEFLSSFVDRLQSYNFYQTNGPATLLERVQGLVSRDKLLDLKRHAELAHMDEREKAVFPAIKFGPLAVSIVLFCMALVFKPDLGGNVHASRCLAMLVFVTTLWVTEAIPYFVTALLIPILVVMMDIMKTHAGVDMTRSKSAHYVLNHMVSHTTILIMGGYSISAAFSRCEIELRIASLLQKQFGNNPRLFILGIMYLGLLLSTLISNHTAPVLCVSILMPIIRDFGVESRFAKTLLLGLAFACNFGGMVTPISSMQNVVAQQALEDAGMTIGFGSWIAVGMPFCVLGVFLAWALLCIIINPTDVKQIPVIVYTKANVVSRKNVFIVATTLITIFGWSSIGATKNFFGDLGIIALMFIIIAFGSGILSEVDFNSFSWHTLFLLGGGNVLGKAISNSELLDYLAHALVDLLPRDNRFLLLVEVVSVTMLISTFVSHTVAALILMPIIVEVGIKIENPVLLGMGAALAVSSGCALPFSSFPNVTSLLVTDDYNRKYLVVKDFLTSGLPMSAVSVAIICTIGYGLIDWILVPMVVPASKDDDDSFGETR